MKSPKEQQKEYSEIEQEAIKWLSETDDMQFSIMELLTMFAGHWQAKLKSMVSSSDVIEPTTKDFYCNGTNDENCQVTGKQCTICKSVEKNWKGVL